MVTIRQVAKEAGVSVATASRALNGMENVTRSTREKIEAAAARLNYVPHSGARNLTRRRTDTIGVILPDLFGEFFSELIRGIDRAVHAEGKTLLLGNMHGSQQETTQAIRAMRGRVDGLVIMPPNSVAETLHTEPLGAFPMVVLNAVPGGGELPSVSVDSRAGAEMVVQHLIERGARRIVHISGPATNHDAIERETAFRNVVCRELDNADPIVLTGDFCEGSGEAAISRLLESGERFDAVFAGNDVMAVEAMASLRDAGYAIGSEMLVAGFDDIPLSRYVSPGLTTVHSEIPRLGELAAHKLLALIEGSLASEGQATVIRPRLAIRGSTAGLAPPRS
ncbi:LacI family DNA-binding transcriptional regulator [Aurantiacibacter spongiae]|uniref:LacI family transcriptional regulator n=1 Tax=Aurantiacibacter spongiae TaxID=2488860 RepID=A0A3N5DBM4_9SPHN|nr:LacI family DNA-binding transcriptional regulator [Aurantiacibacter spongiae]RPF72168.1 LacI family transcriptional regulator [Aurantiacibacter spongiae]